MRYIPTWNGKVMESVDAASLESAKRILRDREFLLRGVEGLVEAERAELVPDYSARRAFMNTPRFVGK